MTAVPQTEEKTCLEDKERRGTIHMPGKGCLKFKLRGEGVEGKP